MEISARNRLRGRITSVNHGAVNSEVTITVADGMELVAIITKHSAESLGLAEGKEVSAVIKASNVMVATGK